MATASLPARLFRGAVLIGLAAALQACQSGRVPVQRLERNALACREPQTAERLLASGTGFQRMADDNLASGACRMFFAGQPVSGRSVRGPLMTFTDAVSGRTYWAAR